MLKQRFLLIFFASVLFFIAHGTFNLSRNTFLLKYYGKEEKALITDIYQQDGSSYIQYSFKINNKEYKGISGFEKENKIDNSVNIYFLPDKPEINDSEKNLELGEIGIFFVFPVSILLLFTGFCLLIKAFIQL